MGIVPDRANHPKRMVGKVVGAMKNAGRFAAASATWGAVNYDPSSNHKINHINDRSIMNSQRKERMKPLQPAKDLSGAYGIKPETPVRKNEWRD